MFQDETGASASINPGIIKYLTWKNMLKSWEGEVQSAFNLQVTRSNTEEKEVVSGAFVNVLKFETYLCDYFPLSPQEYIKQLTSKEGLTSQGQTSTAEPAASSATVCGEFELNSFKIVVAAGNFLKYKADCIVVNRSDKEGLKKVFEEGGKYLQRGLAKLQENNLCERLRPGLLSCCCEYILAAKVPDAEEGGIQQCLNLQRTINSCLQKAAAFNSSSLVFPNMGKGKLNAILSHV